MNSLEQAVDGSLADFRERLEAYHAWHVPLDLLPRVEKVRRAMSVAELAALYGNRTAVLTEPYSQNGGADFIYYAGMAITAVRTADDLSAAQKIRAEGWIRRILFEDEPLPTRVLAFDMGPERVQTGPWEAQVGFSLRALKALADERTAFPGRVFYSYPVQAEKILDKVRRCLAIVDEDRPDAGSAACEVLDRKLRFPLSKLFGFLRDPALRDDHQFRIVFVGEGNPGLVRTEAGLAVSLEPYLRVAGETPFDLLSVNEGIDRDTVESVLGAGVRRG